MVKCFINLEIYYTNENLNHDYLIENELHTIRTDMKYISENLGNEKSGIYQKDFKYYYINYYFERDNICCLFFSSRSDFVISI